MSVVSAQKVGIIPNTLEQQIAVLRRNKLDWNAVLMVHNVFPDDFKILKDFACGSYDVKSKIIKDNRHRLARVLVGLLGKSMNVETMQHILLLIDEMLDLDHERVMSATSPKNIYPLNWPFLKNLKKKDRFTLYMSARILAKIITWSSYKLSASDLRFFMMWLRDRLSFTDNEYVHTVAGCLQIVLRVDSFRSTFVSIEGIPRIVRALQGANSFQIEYQLIFCIWLLTYSPEIAQRMINLKIIPILADIFTRSEQEKVTRVILPVFKNLLQVPESENSVRENCITMIQHKVLKQLSILEQRRFEDEDIIEDIKFLNCKLQASVQALSSFNVYTSELKSGRLEWSPVHRSAQFWRENANRLNESEYELIRLLINLLETTQDPLVLAVASYDIGEYVRYYPRGKEVIEHLGGKHVIMQLLSHDDPTVRYEALLALQKILVQNWDNFGRQIQKDQNLPRVFSRGSV